MPALKLLLDLFLPPIRWVRRLALGFAVFLALVSILMLSIGQWYIHSQTSKPLQLGVSFVPDYARSLGIDPQETMDELLKINVKNFRLVSYWSNIEAEPDKYNFDELDWQFKKAEAANAKISLAVGLRQPRWPECHMPDWAKADPVNVWQPKLEKFMTAVIERYKDSPSLQSYQLENEFFNKFGQCTDFSRDRLVDEYKLVKKLDSEHPVIVSKSNNGIIPAIGQPRPDLTGISVYRRVWDTNTDRYFTYPLPRIYYAFTAGIQKILTGKDSVLHEMQMEAWPSNGQNIADISVAEQNKSMNASMFQDRIDFAKDTGMRKIDLWGAEWWYSRKAVQNDPSIWNEARKTFNEQ